MTRKKKKKDVSPACESTPTPVTDDTEPQASERSGTTESPDDARQELTELKQQLMRVSADYQNYQKRTARQLEQAVRLSRESLVRGLLPVLDNFEHSLNKGTAAQDVTALLQGIQMVHDHLLKILQDAGLARIEVEAGTVFDPNLHEAMMHEESDQLDQNTIVRELASGYLMNDRTLRPARVSVAKPPCGPPDDESSAAPCGPGNQSDDLSDDQPNEQSDDQSAPIG